MTQLRYLLTLTFLICALTALPCVAQTEDAIISGRVTDASGAVVGGVTLRLESAERGTVTETTTNKAGIYVFAAVHPGVYHITARKQGFRQVDVVGLTANVQAHIEQNVSLQVGAASESVTVNGDIAKVNTESAAVGTVIDRQFVENIPMNGRSFQTLIQLSPGVINTPVSSDGSNQGQFSINGQRTDSNYFTVDGVAANFDTTLFDAGIGQAVSGSLPAANVQGGFSNLVTVDDLQEFRIQTSTFAPEFGRQPGGQISLVTRSGTNQFHGSVFEYFRNDVTDAMDYFDTKKPALRYNDFGGSVGGPVIFPGYNGRNRTFFFFSYEGQRFLLPQPRLQLTTPTQWARDNAPNPVSQALLSAFPLPNGADTMFDGSGNPIGGLFTQAYSNLNNMNAYSIRVDQNIGQKLSFFFRYDRAPSYSNVLNTENAVQFDHFVKNTQTITVGAAHLITPHLVNEIRFNTSRLSGQDDLVDSTRDGAIPPSDNLFLPANYGGDQRRWTYFLFPYQDPITGYPLGTSGGPSARNLGRSLNFTDNISWAKGSHQFKFGVDYRRNTPVSGPESLIVGNYFLSMSDIDSATPTFSLYDRLATFTYLNTNFSAYGEDTWRVSPRLSLTYGLRWDVDSAPRGLNGQNIYTLAQPPDLSQLDQTSLQVAPTGTPLFPASYSHFAPRIGVAYQIRRSPDHELIWRTGFGVFYDLSATPFAGGQWPYDYSNFLSPGVPLPVQATDIPLPPVDATPSPTNQASNIPVAARGFTMPRTYQWNLTLEQALGTSRSLSVGWVGAAGRKLLHASNINLAPDNTTPNVYYSPNFSSLNYVDNGSSSNYDSLQVQFNQRLSHGLQAIVNYTWSHSLDDSSNDSNVFAPGFLYPPSINYGNSDFDVHHNFSAAVTYDLPSPAWSAISKAVLGGWSVDSIMQARTGFPYDVYLNEVDPNFFFYKSIRRADIVPSVPQIISDNSVPGGWRVNPNAFAPPSTPFGQGDMGRNSLHGFGMWQADLGIHRNFSLTERVKLDFRAEAFNIFNHPNFMNPTTYIDATQTPPVPGPDFGVATQSLARGFGGGGNTGGFNPLFQSGGPRSLQLALRLSF